MKHFKKLVGERIYLSPINIEDATSFTKWFCDFKVSDGMGMTNFLPSVTGQKEAITNYLKSGNYEFSIISLDDDKLIGNIGLFNVDQKNRLATVFIFIGEEEFRNNGYGTEALGLMLEYAFKYLNLNNVMLFVYSYNEVAINCYRKLGFKEIGIRKNSHFLNGKYYDIVYMDILASEFNGEYIRNK